MVAALRDLRHRPVAVAVPGVLIVGAGALVVGFVLGFGPWIAFLALLAPIAALSYQRPQRGVLIFAAILPFDGMIKVLGPGILGSWKQGFIVALLALTFVCPDDARAVGRRKLPGWVVALGALLALSLVSALFIDRTTAITGLRISYFSLLFAWVVWRCPLTRKDRDHLVSVFMVMAFVTSVVGIWQQLVGAEYLADLGYEYNENIRFTVGFTLRSFSTFNLPFSFGFYLMIAVLIALPMALADPSRLRSKLFFLSMPVIAGGLLYSFVRGAMFGLAIGLLYLAFHRYKLLIWGIPLVLVAALFVPAGATLTGAVFGSNSLGDRTSSWSQRIDQVAEHPFGTGIGTTGAAADRTAILKKTDRDLAFQPDNSYLKVTFELGVFGLWLFVMMLVSMFLYTRGVERRVSGIDRDFITGVSAQYLAIMSASLVATYFELVPMDQLFWLMIAVVATMMPPIHAEQPAIGSAEEPGPPQLVSGERG
jgi:O-antigen ligase